MVVDFLEVMNKIVGCGNVRMTIVKEGNPSCPDFDLGIRNTLLEPGENEHFIEEMYQWAEKGILYYVTDYFDTEYCIMPIPEEEGAYGDFIIMGPYRDMALTELQLSELMEQKNIPVDYANELKEYYHAVPSILNIDQWREVCATLYRTLYRAKVVQVRYVVHNSLEKEFHQEIYKDELSFKIIEERYAAEGEIMKAVSNGNMEEALKNLAVLGKFRLADRYKDPIRNIRNLLITLNTLLRKAAEMGGVHPAHIDALSSQMAKRIETISSNQESARFRTEMLRKYCLLVRNYSLRGCSPVVQKVVNHINLNLTEDLSLKRLAVEYSVNASYLSALFKKDMGVTLTDYISQQRVRKAITLINSSDMQIQDIASESGIYDVNYFRKLFKKITGKTPTEYVKQVRTHGSV